MAEKYYRDYEAQYGVNTHTAEREAWKNILSTASSTRNNTAELNQAYMRNQLSEEEFIRRLTGGTGGAASVFDPTKGPQINTGSGPQTMAQAGVMMNSNLGGGFTTNQSQVNQAAVDVSNLVTQAAQKNYGATPITSTAIAPATVMAKPVTPITAPSFNASMLPNLSAPASGTLSPEEQKAQNEINRIQGLTTDLTGKEAFQTQQETAQGVPEKAKLVNDLSSQLRLSQLEAANIQATTQTNQGVTSAIDSRQRAETLRKNSVQSLQLYAQLEMAKGNLGAAQDAADRAVTLKYAPIEANIKAALMNLELIQKSPEYTNAEKKRATEQALALQAQQSAVANAKEDTATIQSWALAALQNGASTVQFQQLMAMASETNPNLNKALMVYAPFSKDPNALKKSLLDLENQRLQNIKLGGDINKVTIENREASSLVGGQYVSEVTKKPLTEGERASLGYATRMTESGAIIDRVGENFTTKTSYGGSLPTALQSSERQVYEQAKRDFINAKLRKESGAAIPPEEFTNAERQYFPQAGEGTEVIANKQANRNNVIRNMFLEGGKPSQASSQSSQILISPDGKRQVRVSDITPAQVAEAKKAGWK